MPMNHEGVAAGLDAVVQAGKALAEIEQYVEMGQAYISLDGRLYKIDRVDQMIQRDEITVVCPVIVAESLVLNPHRS